ncbi:MAG: hypothetical protein L6R42_007741, partial [Xanthoria sp. 1 TBL-2021]
AAIKADVRVLFTLAELDEYVRNNPSGLEPPPSDSVISQVVEMPAAVEYLSMPTPQPPSASSVGTFIDETGAISSGKLIFSAEAWEQLLGRSTEELAKCNGPLLKYLENRILFLRLTILFGWSQKSRHQQKWKSKIHRLKALKDDMPAKDANAVVEPSMQDPKSDSNEESASSKHPEQADGTPIHTGVEAVVPSTSAHPVSRSQDSKLSLANHTMPESSTTLSQDPLANAPRGNDQALVATPTPDEKPPGVQQRVGAIAAENENRQRPRPVTINPISQEPQLSQQKTQSAPALSVSEESRSIENKAVDTILENDSSLVLPSIPEVLEERSTQSSKHEIQQAENSLPEATGPAQEAARSIFESRPHNDKGKPPMRRHSSEAERLLNGIRGLTNKRLDTPQSPPSEALSDEIRARDKRESPSTDLAHDALIASPEPPAQAPEIKSRSSKPEAAPPAKKFASEPIITPPKPKAPYPTAPQVVKKPVTPESKPTIAPAKPKAQRPTAPQVNTIPATLESEPTTTAPKPKAPQTTAPPIENIPAAPESAPANPPPKPKTPQPTTPQVNTIPAVPESKPIIAPAKPKAPQPTTSQAKKEPAAPALKSKPEPESRSAETPANSDDI